ncbi:MAG: PAS domain-containing protein [Negativicutes bacterium]
MDSSQMNHYMSQLWNDERLFIIALDKDGRVTYANQKTQELFCNPIGGLMGEVWIEIAVLPENRREAETRFQRMMAGKMDQLSQVGDMDVVACDGTRLRILWNNHLLHDSEGKITGMLSFGQDITEQERVQFRLGLHQEVAKIIGESSSFTQAAEAFIRTMCERFDWDFGEVWIHGKNGNVMIWHTCWNQGDIDYSDFRELSRGLVFAKGKGLPGVVWEYPEFPSNYTYAGVATSKSA